MHLTTSMHSPCSSGSGNGNRGERVAVLNARQCHQASHTCSSSSPSIRRTATASAVGSQR
eukprot:6198050-Pleurochrysis_carterae.AAC.4